ncbi:MAG TPA: hypothetical protein ENO38_04940 [Nitrososphaeria archaeon]|jgi:hypothetical protein|uniref:No similarity n=1 Tax=Conexivisphaera calida TaxID=1874277 RepID=A0A4P2VJX2_9ARCH|nr:hypothetical protein [Conexivisphaera calida]PMP97452.1 MAG: hypothetical protein C0167_00985 [Nitrososphaera sp.]BBE41588.1 no similarity [Conexivisphaera calida]HEU16997.1 hypothetical protein [Nitrososphaeria archaeon]
MSQPEIIDFEIVKDCGWMELKLANGAILRVKVEPSAVAYAGNDPNTGLPIFSIQIGAIVQLAKVPRELMRRPGQGEQAQGAYR